ncbi:MAG: acyltransferase, partial [Chloroflexi bacterium]|nr:acyltransferase [Chloroflexota bacterium]
EKYFFKPGNLGFPVFDTPFGTKIGILICYDRHFPEAARVLGLGGADVIFVPTATSGMTKYLWDLELKAHAVANLYYVCGVNRVGVDEGGSTRNHFGSSLIVDPKANVLAQASDDRDEVVCADVDPAFIAETRRLWSFYRDRRPDLYGPVAGRLTGAGR